MQLGQLVLQQSHDDGIEGRDEVHKQDLGTGLRGVQVLQDEVEAHRGQGDGVQVLQDEVEGHRGQGDGVQVLQDEVQAHRTGMMLEVLSRHSVSK